MPTRENFPVEHDADFLRLHQPCATEHLNGNSQDRADLQRVIEDVRKDLQQGN